MPWTYKLEVQDDICLRLYQNRNYIELRICCLRVSNGRNGKINGHLIAAFLFLFKYHPTKNVVVILKKSYPQNDILRIGVTRAMASRIFVSWNVRNECPRKEVLGSASRRPDADLGGGVVVSTACVIRRSTLTDCRESPKKSEWTRIKRKVMCRGR